MTELHQTEIQTPEEVVDWFNDVVERETATMRKYHDPFYYAEMKFLWSKKRSKGRFGRFRSKKWFDISIMICGFETGAHPASVLSKVHSYVKNSADMKRMWGHIVGMILMTHLKVVDEPKEFGKEKTIQIFHLFSPFYVGMLAKRYFRVVCTDDEDLPDEVYDKKKLDPRFELKEITMEIDPEKNDIRVFFENPFYLEQDEPDTNGGV